MLKKSASGVLAILSDLRARKLGALRRSRSRTMSTLRASKRLRPCWTDFFEHFLPLKYGAHLNLLLANEVNNSTGPKT